MRETIVTAMQGSMLTKEDIQAASTKQQSQLLPFREATTKKIFKILTIIIAASVIEEVTEVCPHHLSPHRGIIRVKLRKLKRRKSTHRRKERAGRSLNLPLRKGAVQRNRSLLTIIRILNSERGKRSTMRKPRIPGHHLVRRRKVVS